MAVLSLNGLKGFREKPPVSCDLKPGQLPVRPVFHSQEQPGGALQFFGDIDRCRRVPVADNYAMMGQQHGIIVDRTATDRVGKAGIVRFENRGRGSDVR